MSATRQDGAPSRRILVVDDQPDIRELLKTILSLRDFEVTEAPSGPKALEILADGQEFDMVLLDVQMPEMDGWDALSTIRERYGELGPRVVLCTVKGHPRDLIHGWMLGCDGYVWKPFDLNAIIDEVKDVLERQGSDRVKVRRNAIAEAESMLRAVT
jgi:DNA-binding response OmpR family regulator